MFCNIKGKNIIVDLEKQKKEREQAKEALATFLVDVKRRQSPRGNEVDGEGKQTSEQDTNEKKTQNKEEDSNSTKSIQDGSSGEGATTQNT